jgi:hypothetical protein
VSSRIFAKISTLYNIYYQGTRTKKTLHFCHGLSECPRHNCVRTLSRLTVVVDKTKRSWIVVIATASNKHFKFSLKAIVKKLLVTKLIVFWTHKNSLLYYGHIASHTNLFIQSRHRPQLAQSIYTYFSIVVTLNCIDCGSIGSNLKKMVFYRNFTSSQPDN